MNLENYILENFTLKINSHVPPPCLVTHACACGVTSRSQHVILSFPDTGQLLTYSSNPHLLINMVVTHHQLKSIGLVLFDYRLPLLFAAHCEAEGVLYVEPGSMHYMHMWVERALADPRRGDP